MPQRWWYWWAFLSLSISPIRFLSLVAMNYNSWATPSASSQALSTAWSSASNVWHKWGQGFAQPRNTSKTFSWISSFQLECQTPKASEELPENPYMSCCLQPDAMSLGLKPCKYGNYIIFLESGSLKLVLKTTRPLMMLHVWTEP